MLGSALGERKFGQTISGDVFVQVKNTVAFFGEADRSQEFPSLTE